MPYKSTAQRGYLHANLPSVAAKFDAHTPKGLKLPKHVGDAHESRKRHGGDGGAAHKLGSMANVARHNATHMKQKMKKIGY